MSDPTPALTPRETMEQTFARFQETVLRVKSERDALLKQVVDLLVALAPLQAELERSQALLAQIGARPLPKTEAQT